MIEQKSRFISLVTAVALSLVCIHLGGGAAQKTAQRWSSASSSQQAVYGGYQPQQSAPVDQPQRAAPAVTPARQRGQNYARQQQTNKQPVYQQQPQPQQSQQQESSYEAEASSSSAEADAEPASYGSVSGQPGRDFPAYTRVPKTSFSCEGLPYDYGMYADEETGCQAYHLCYNGRKESFLCGPGTVFNQRILHCDYWYSVECSKSSQYYGSNAYMGSSQPEPGPAEANSAPASQSQAAASYARPAASRPAAPSSFKPQQQSFSRNTQQQQQQVDESY